MIEIARTSLRASSTHATSEPDGYRPGVCNIGPEEISRRRRGAWAATVLAVGVYLVLVAAAVPDVWRLVVALPAAAAAVSWLQVRERFCVGFGSAGVFNFGAYGSTESIVDDDARRADQTQGPVDDRPCPARRRPRRSGGGVDPLVAIAAASPRPSCLGRSPGESP